MSGLTRAGGAVPRAMHRRPALLVAAAVTGMTGLGLLLVHVCADGGAMGSAYQTCRCRGFEWEAYDRTAADGPRRTLCIGTIQSRTCHRLRDGAVVPCPGR